MAEIGRHDVLNRGANLRGRHDVKREVSPEETTVGAPVTLVAQPPLRQVVRIVLLRIAEHDQPNPRVAFSQGGQSLTGPMFDAKIMAAKKTRGHTRRTVIVEKRFLEGITRRSKSPCWTWSRTQSIVSLYSPLV